jgi:membrane dipeptidase
MSVKGRVNSIVDAHNDLLLEIAYRADESNPFGSRWLSQLRGGGVALQVCPISAQFEDLPESGLRHALEQIVACYGIVRDNPTDVVFVRTRADLEDLAAGDRIGLLLSMEGAEPLGYSVDLADVFWNLGVRMFSLTWNRRNPFADGVGEPSAGGLSRLGRKLVERLVSLGAIVDLAHASEGTFADVLEAMDDGTAIVSHAACRAVFESPRNLTDAQLRAIAERDGVLGMMVLPPVIAAERSTIERVVDHIDHAVEIMGISHVGLGGDFFQQVALSGAVRKPPDSLRPAGMDLAFSIAELAGPADYPRLIEAMTARGYDDASLAAISCENFLRVFRRALPVEA